MLIIMGGVMHNICVSCYLLFCFSIFLKTVFCFSLFKLPVLCQLDKNVFHFLKSKTIEILWTFKDMCLCIMFKKNSLTLKGQYVCFLTALWHKMMTSVERL